MHEGRIKTIQSKLDQCKSGSQNAIATKKELDLCRQELSDEQKSKKDLKRNIKILQNNNDKLQNQLTSKNYEIENLRNRIRGLEIEKTRIQSDSTTTGTTIGTTSGTTEEIAPPIWNDSSESTLDPEIEESEWWISESESTTVSDFDFKMREPKSEAVGERCGIKFCPVGQKCTSYFWGDCK